MNTEPELLNERLERLAILLDEIMPQCALLVRDAIELLKEQITTSTNESRIFHCEKCGYGIDDIFLSDEHNYPIKPCFYPNCGRSVKRDD